LTEDIQAVELVGVSIDAPGHVFPTYVTTQNGKFDHGMQFGADPGFQASGRGVCWHAVSLSIKSNCRMQYIATIVQS
jgi:hypothetical protein